MREYKGKFNSKQYARIVELIDNEKYKYALDELKKYMQEYPKDNENALYQYGNIMLKLGNIDEAEETFKYIEKIATKQFAKFWSLYKLGEIYESRYNYDLTKYYFEQAYIHRTNQSEDVINFGLARLAIREGKLDLAENYLKEIKGEKLGVPYKYYLARLKFLQGNKREAAKVIATLTMEELGNNKTSKFFISIINNLNKHLKDNSICYHDNQLINYNKDKALEHIIERHVITGDFDDNIDIPKMFKEIDSLISFKNKQSNTLSDYYFIDYPNYESKKIKVVCLPNTKNVLSMYPYNDTTIEKEYTGEDIQGTVGKTKVLTHKSQIDKFNSRYKNQIVM